MWMIPSDLPSFSNGTASAVRTPTATPANLAPGNSATASLTSWTGRGRPARSPSHPGPRELGYGIPKVVNVERPSLSYRSSSEPAKLDGNSHPYVVYQTNRAKMRNGDLGITFDSPDHRIVGTTESIGIFCHGIQHRLGVRWRFGDHAQDRVGCSLLLQGL